MHNGSDNGNGSGKAHPAHTAEIRITMDLCSHTVKVDGACPNLDCMLSMLASATRAIEDQRRQAAAVQFAGEMQRNSENERIRQMVTGRRQ